MLLSSQPSLPVLPVPRTQALIVLRNPDASVQDLLAVIEGDPSLTARVIRAANSAMSWPIDPIATARDAIVRIGANACRRLLGTAVLEDQLRAIGADSPVDTQELWRYTIATAVMTEAMFEDEHQRALGFTVGLLHDLGRLAFLGASPSRYRVVLESVAIGLDPWLSERTQFGFAHTEAGAEIARAWSLPGECTEVMLHHHQRNANGLPGAVATARLAAIYAGFSDGLVSATDLPQDWNIDPVVLEILDRVGGASGLADRIRWYRNASSAW
jgi:HD-like signal output (HDOD) protein